MPHVSGTAVILIVGVTGVLGRAVAQRLRAARRRVRGLTRTPERAQDLAQLGVEVVAGDLIDRASLERACAGVDAVLACAHQLRGVAPHASEAVDDAGHRALIAAARDARVRHFVYTSALRAASDHPVDFYRTKACIEAELATSGLPYTILRPSAFMEWHVHNLLGAGILATGAATLYGAGDNPCNFVAGDDVAQVAVAALTNAAPRDGSIDLGGPDNLTRNDVAALYFRLSRQPSRLTHVPIEAMRAMMAGGDLAPPFVHRLLALGIWTDTTDQTFDGRALPAPFVTPQTRVATFVEARVQDACPA